MITKEALVGLLEEAYKTEESAIPLYTKHIGSTLFLSGLEEEKQQRIRQILNRLECESENHSRKFQYLINQVKKRAKDVY